jgi:hypothetical protein
MKSFLKQDPQNPHKFVFIWWGKPINITLYGAGKTTLNNAGAIAIICAIITGSGYFLNEKWDRDFQLELEKKRLELEEKNLQFAIEEAFKKCAFEEWKIKYNTWAKSRSRKLEDKPIWMESSFVKPVISGKSYWPLLILIMKYVIIVAIPFILYEFYRYIYPKIPGIFSSIKRRINVLMVRCRMKKDKNDNNDNNIHSTLSVQNNNEKDKELERAFEKEIQEKEREYEKNLQEYRKKNKIVISKVNDEEKMSYISLSFLEQLVYRQSIAWILSRIFIWFVVIGSMLISTPIIFRVVCYAVFRLILGIILINAGLAIYDSSLLRVLSLEIRILFAFTGTLYLHESMYLWVSKKILYDNNHWISKIMKPFIKKNSRFPQMVIITMTKMEREELIMKYLTLSKWECFKNCSHTEIENCIRNFLAKQDHEEEQKKKK